MRQIPYCSALGRILAIYFNVSSNSWKKDYIHIQRSLHGTHFNTSQTRMWRFFFFFFLKFRQTKYNKQHCRPLQLGRIQEHPQCQACEHILVAILH